MIYWKSNFYIYTQVGSGEWRFVHNRFVQIIWSFGWTNWTESPPEAIHSLASAVLTPLWLLIESATRKIPEWVWVNKRTRWMKWLTLPLVKEVKGDWRDDRLAGDAVSTVTLADVIFVTLSVICIANSSRVPMGLRAESKDRMMAWLNIFAFWDHQSEFFWRFSLLDCELSICIFISFFWFTFLPKRCWCSKWDPLFPLLGHYVLCCILSRSG